ncbi:MAG: hypothetical protein KC492_42915, partial [Myxococcales bacterium]|nr:hypothetical protein [Myxococcales bacterium]
LEMAVNLSRSNQYQAAAKSYEKIFELAQRYPKRRRLSGYAKHYLHYNRYKAGDERLPDTVRGYGDSLKFWPENALFHSRQVRALFLDRHEDEALAAFDSAWRAVLSPEESSRYLVDRLVRRLLDRQLVVPALAILERLPPGITIDPVLERLLVQATSRGWQVARLWIPGVEPVSLREPVEGMVQLCDDGSYLARVGSFTTTSSDRFGAVMGATREALFNQLAHVWVQETSHLSSRQEKFSHQAYAQILQLGPDVIPSILRWIQRGGRGHWDRALDSLATSRPENLTGPLSAVMKQWVAWGVEQKLIGEARDVHRLG